MSGTHQEVELKGRVDDWDRRVAAVIAAGGALALSGTLEDLRFDTPDRSLARLDRVLRVRVFRDREGVESATLDVKGATFFDGGYKRREEMSTVVGDGATLVRMLRALGYEVSRAIDREIEQYVLGGATLRFERYPRMDPLLEVEGTEEEIERAIELVGIPRAEFTTERLTQFAARFERRTGMQPALCTAELRGERPYERENG